MKKILVRARTIIKFASILAIAIALIIGIITLVYKPTYSVYLNDEFVRIHK